MTSRNPTDWMWAQACALIDEAERMHRQFVRLSVSERMQAVWEPPVDVFEDEREVVIVIALPGVAAERVEVTMESGALVVRAESRFPFAGSRHVVRRLEIPYGAFERRIPLPVAGLAAGTREAANGCLVLRLRKTAWTGES
jgi:HSP20 family molecular chaperone IbpA